MVSAQPALGVQLPLWPVNQAVRASTEPTMSQAGQLSWLQQVDPERGRTSEPGCSLSRSVQLPPLAWTVFLAVLAGISLHRCVSSISTSRLFGALASLCFLSKKHPPVTALWFGKGLMLSPPKPQFTSTSPLCCNY